MNDVDARSEGACQPGRLEERLQYLRKQARVEGQQEALIRWAKQHPEIATGDHWCERAWWGVTAGELVRKHLYDPASHYEALCLLGRADWSLAEQALCDGGLIIATAHLGPPQFLMNVLVDKSWPLLCWTDNRSMPAWFSAGREAVFLNPVITSQRNMLMVKSALHLRQSGVVLGAADLGTGQQVVMLKRLGRTWRFSLGLPALARKMNIPVVTCLALWSGNNVELSCRRLDAPDHDLPEAVWYETWIERYWEIMEPVIRSSPENLRFIRSVLSQKQQPTEDAI